MHLEENEPISGDHEQKQPHNVPPGLDEDYESPDDHPNGIIVRRDSGGVVFAPNVQSEQPNASDCDVCQDEKDFNRSEEIRGVELIIGLSAR